MPSMFCLGFLVAIYIFVRVEEVDVAIIEVGTGGQFDGTNVIQRPVVCGITALHLDHQDVLGNTIGEIAWHKAGIFKKGVPAVTTPQSSHCAMEVLMNRANERECPLFVAPPLNESQLGEGLCLGIAGGKQLYNAALAVQLARIWLQDKNGLGLSAKLGKVYQGPLADVADIPELSTSKLSAEMMTGLVNTRLAGRAQIMKKGNVTYYLDGAHTTGSMEQCAEWFQDEATKERSTIHGKVVRALVFSMAKPRQAAPHLQYLKTFKDHVTLNAVLKLHARDFSTLVVDHLSLTYDPAEAKERTAQQVEDWEAILSARSAGQPNVSADQPCVSASLPSTVSALWWASLGKNVSLEALARADLGMDGGELGEGGMEVPDVDAVHVQVLVTGSLVMVGRAIKVLTGE
ncbi:hypothetical protein BaRGS_00021357 [Batillaria attramentaria]|uniref:tetrahydrofolate synthase n=1 Tax=Batillaria attramentaria TaxID=370345 RepID=A0ABD0KJL6_9CAEN